MAECPLSTTKQYLTMTARKQDPIPPPYRAWCNACSEGFMSIDELSAHNKAHLARHQGRQ